MSVEQTDKLSSDMTGPGAQVVRPPRRPRAAVWPLDTGVSEDTFATPSQVATGEVDPESLAGPEPAVFGGANPAAQDDAQALDGGDVASEDAEAISEPLGTALDDAVRGDELIPDAPKIDYARIAKSTPFLLSAMVGVLVIATYVIRMAVPTQTYVQTTVHFNNYTKLNELEVADLQVELNKLLRTYPLRAEAWQILQKKSPGIAPGFLNSGLTFHRLDAISWDDAGTVSLRIDSEDPGSDLTRLSAITEAFYSQLSGRAAKLDEYKSQLKGQQNAIFALQAQDGELKGRIDQLLPDAQRYIDLKQAMQAMERYLELADMSNPLRLVARQNLSRLVRQVNDAREVSVKRDDLLAQRVDVQKRIQTVSTELARLQRSIDVFVYPDAPDPKGLSMHDTRPHQRWILRMSWIAIVMIFAGIISIIHTLDNRAAERHRRERRELLNARAAGEKK